MRQLHPLDIADQPKPWPAPSSDPPSFSRSAQEKDLAERRLFVLAVVLLVTLILVLAIILGVLGGVGKLSSSSDSDSQAAPPPSQRQSTAAALVLMLSSDSPLLATSL